MMDTVDRWEVRGIDDKGGKVCMYRKTLLAAKLAASNCSALKITNVEIWRIEETREE